MNAAPAVRASSLVRRYGYLRALDGIDLEARPGAIVLLLGANGAGKTTLLRVLAGLLPASEGDCEIFGRPVGEDDESRRNVGFLSHSLALYPDLSAAENLRFFARLYGVEGREARIGWLLDEMDLGDWKDEPVRNFSRGMKQRLALARAFLHDPPLLLLDEPFTGLDAKSASRLAARLAELRRAGKSILLASHRLEVAGPVGDEAVVLDRGRICERIDLRAVEPELRAGRLAEALERVS